ncbi:hypothetical protein D3C77_336560 [compost metagenome]
MVASDSQSYLNPCQAFQFQYSLCLLQHKLHTLLLLIQNHLAHPHFALGNRHCEYQQLARLFWQDQIRSGMLLLHLLLMLTDIAERIGVFRSELHLCLGIPLEAWKDA